MVGPLVNHRRDVAAAVHLALDADEAAGVDAGGRGSAKKGDSAAVDPAAVGSAGIDPGAGRVI